MHRPVSFFTSRWVEPLEHVSELEPAALARGFRAAAVAAGLKRSGLDLGVLVCDRADAVSAARFTTNARVGAPVIASREADATRLRAIVANSGGSNTGDGQRGLDTARATQRLTAELLGLEPAQVGVASTGVIGTELSREPLLDGVRRAVEALGQDADALARAILTSDSGPKQACLEVRLPAGTVRISAQAKGAGMISPRFATMFCFVQTDAALSAQTLDLLTTVCVKRSFDRISVDGQLSTSDTVFVQASGASGVQVEAETEDELRLGEAMDVLMRQLALMIVGDGEGAQRIGRIVVTGDDGVVEPVARAVADSPLVKTALHGGDPNFGRILQAAGMAYPYRDGFVADLEIEGQLVVSAGEAVVEDLRELEPLVAGAEVEYRLKLPGSGGESEVFFSDLSPEYVVFNSRYTS
ncbi:MAG: bifunctional ornithine acetyltransferase/N-acetylglutamate synthase [Actinomycetota bacterium]|nr:bifunctional ornithine acetyltransferase/N-acetylglutamate synthase [Actinomycetota bacterium]